MKTAVMAITRRGTETALKIGGRLGADVFGREDLKPDFKAFVRRVFGEYDALVFVMACGIAVRSIAPYIRNKQRDPAVIVVDEKGDYAISLLSGHIGGANAFARKIAAVTGGTAVITTATDVCGITAFDVFAADNGCVIENIGDLKFISSELVNGGSVSFYTDQEIIGNFCGNIVTWEAGKKYKRAVAFTSRLDMPVESEKLLVIRPKNLILGIGCKRGTGSRAIKDAVEVFMRKNKRSMLSLKKVASIDLKENEKGILEFCSEMGLDFYAVPRDEIRKEEDRFETSDFVRKTVGVGSVAEACAVLGGRKTKLICGKTVCGGITLALAEEEVAFYI